MLYINKYVKYYIFSVFMHVDPKIVGINVYFFYGATYAHEEFLKILYYTETVDLSNISPL